MSLSKFNKNNSKFNWEMPENAPFGKLSSLAEINGLDTKYVIRGMYINKKGDFGEQPVILLDDMFVNLPTHLTEVVYAMLEDEDVINAVNNERAGFKIYTYKDRNNITRYSVEWLDL